LRFARVAAPSAPAWSRRSWNSDGWTVGRREMPRDKVILECTDCKSRNYFTTKNKRKHPQRMETRKFCRRCGGHRLHKESK